MVTGRLRDLWRGLPRQVRRFLRWLTSDELVTTGSSLAFYAMLSIPPMVLIALWAVGGVVSDEVLDGLGQEVEDRAPEALPVGDVVRGLVDVATRVGPFSALAALWPATTYGAALARAFTRIAPESDRAIRSWRGRLLVLGVLLLLPFVVFAAMAVLAFGPDLLGSDGLALSLAIGAGAVLAFAAIVAVLFSLFQLRDTRPSDIAVGVLTATGLQVLVTVAYVGYLELFADFEQRYGASQLATTVLLGLWLLLSNGVLLVSYRLVLRRCDRRTRLERAEDVG